MNAVFAFVRLKNEYSVIPNAEAVETRGRGPLAVHIPDDTRTQACSGGPPREGWRRPTADCCKLRSGEGANTANCDDSDKYEGRSAWADDYNGDDDDDGGDSFVPPRESGVYREPQVQHLSREEMWQKYQSDDGAPFSSLVQDMRSMCVQRRGERAVAWRPVGSVCVTPLKEERNSSRGGDAVTATDHYQRQQQRVCITMERTRYRTYAQLWERIVALGCGLRALGLSQGAMVGICEDTRWEWLVACYGAWSQRFVCVVLGDERVSMERVAAEVDLAAMVCKRKLLPKLHAVFAAEPARHMPVFIVTDASRQLDMEAALTSPGGAEAEPPHKDVEACGTVVLTWGELLWRGREEWQRRRAAHEEYRKMRQKRAAETIIFHANGGEAAAAPPSLSFPLRQYHNSTTFRPPADTAATAEVEAVSLPRSSSSGEERCCRRVATAAAAPGACATVADEVLCNTEADAEAEEEEDDAVLHFPTNPMELALVMYKAGDPKGVMLSHGALKAAVTAQQERLDVMNFDKGLRSPMPDRSCGTSFVSAAASNVAHEEEQQRPTYLAYLPLSHIMEFVTENVFLHRGYLVCYGTPHTLHQRRGNTCVTPQSDLCEFRPVVFMGVPRVLNELHKTLESTLPSNGGFLANIFRVAYSERRRALLRCLDTPFLNKTVFSKPRALLGGRCRTIISGGAPLRAETQEFLEVVCGAAVLQGYGLTESAGCGTLQYMWDTQRECVGGLLGPVELKLRDIGPWRHGSAWPCGEALLRGPTLMSGYYARPKETARVLDKDGWLHTGDVVELQCNGSLRVIARVKNVAKNTCGECIDLEGLERVYAQHPLCIPGGVCVLVHPHRSYVAALVLTDEARARRFLQRSGLLPHYPWPYFLREPAFHRAAAASLAAFARAAGRKSHDCVRTARVLLDEWCCENGVVTASGAICRRVVERRYAGVIGELFQRDE